MATSGRRDGNFTELVTVSRYTSTTGARLVFVQAAAIESSNDARFSLADHLQHRAESLKYLHKHPFNGNGLGVIVERL